MSSTQATKEPAPEPLPGPTGILLFFDHFMKSATIRKYPEYFILIMISSSFWSRS